MQNRTERERERQWKKGKGSYPLMIGMKHDMAEPGGGGGGGVGSGIVKTRLNY